MYHVFLWNGFAGCVQIFRGSEEDLRKMATIHMEEGNDVIYFYAELESFTLKAM